MKYEIGDYEVWAQYINAEKFGKFLGIEITGQDQEDFRKVKEDLKKIRGWGGEASIDKEIKKVFDRELEVSNSDFEVNISDYMNMDEEL